MNRGCTEITVYPVIFAIIYFSLFTQSLLNRKIFKTQQFLSRIDCYKKLFELQKMTVALEKIHIFPIFANIVTNENIWI